jgi:hypothetical protein
MLVDLVQDSRLCGTGRVEAKVSICSSTVGECRPGIETWIGRVEKDRGALLGAWDERAG